VRTNTDREVTLYADGIFKEFGMSGSADWPTERRGNWAWDPNKQKGFTFHRTVKVKNGMPMPDDQGVALYDWKKDILDHRN
jgi:hypothetical protein